MTLRLATFLAVAVAALHSIFAMAELREEPLPIVSCIDIQMSPMASGVNSPLRRWS